jgi:hypothetical protein
MAQKTLPASAETAIVGVIDPDLNTAGTQTTAWISASTFQKFMAIVIAGALGSNATLDAKIEQASDATGTGAKDLADAAITQMTEAGGDSDKQAIIEFWSEDLDLENGFTHVRLSMTVATASSDSAAILLGCAPRYAPASASDADSVAEIVTV